MPHSNLNIRSQNNVLVGKSNELDSLNIINPIKRKFVSEQPYKTNLSNFMKSCISKKWKNVVWKTKKSTKRY